MKIEANDRLYVYNEKSGEWAEEREAEEPNEFLLRIVQDIWNTTRNEYDIGYASPLIARAMATARVLGGIAYDFGKLREYPKDRRDLIR